jgi:hypothetical protein
MNYRNTRRHSTAPLERNEWTASLYRSATTELAPNNQHVLRSPSSATAYSVGIDPGQRHPGVPYSIPWRFSGLMRATNCPKARRRQLRFNQLAVDHGPNILSETAPADVQRFVKAFARYSARSVLLLIQVCSFGCCHIQGWRVSFE